MKNTLDELLRSSFTSSEMIMYKSDGPSRKLRILSDHWKSKAKENAEKSHAAGAPVEAEDSSTDHPAILASRSRTPSSNQASSKLGTHHSYSTIKPNNLPTLAVKPASKKLKYASGNYGKDRTRKQNEQKKREQEIKDTAEEVKRMLERKPVLAHNSKFLSPRSL